MLVRNNNILKILLYFIYFCLVNGDCVETKFITPELKLTNDPFKVALLFDSKYPELFNILVNITTAEIQGLNQTLFQYEIIKSSENGFFVKIIKLKSIVNPLLMLKISLAFELSTNSEMRLKKTFLSINLWNYVDQDSPEVKEMVQTASAVKSGDLMSKTTSNLATVIGGESSSSFRGGMLAESIKLLR